jgi:hypothetical protein
MAAILSTAAAAHAAPGLGKISGVVVDPTGTPQMGATVWVTAEGVFGAAPAQILTNQHGVFSSERLQPGQYSLKVTLAGFLPGIERHIKVNSNLTTLVRVELDSVFASLDRMRRRSDASTDPDEWKWVLRSSAATRPILQWQDGEVTIADAGTANSENRRNGQPRARLELTSGSLNRGSASHLPDAAGTAFAYDQSVGRTGRLVLAGQMSYERSAAGGLSTVWIPSGQAGVGSTTSLVLRETKLGPNGLTFRGMRLDHESQLVLGDRLKIQYAAEYVMVGLGRAASSFRPRVEVDAQLSPGWMAYAKLAAMPAAPETMGSDLLLNALNAMDAFPALLWRNHDSPVLEGGWHDEMGFERRVGKRSYLDIAGYRDRLNDVAVYGRGGTSHPDFYRDIFSDAILYDGGSSNSWGTRAAYRQKLNDDIEVTGVYAWGGALEVADPVAAVHLRDALETRYLHSLAARISAHIPGSGTTVVAGYKWLSGPAVSHQDPFGESAMQLDPYLNLSIRQPLPMFVMNGRWEVLADCRNLLAQGYVPVTGRNGQVMLVPAVRSFRGGVSFQF